MLTSVPLTLGDETEPLPPALVPCLLPDGSLEEPLAALTGTHPIVLARRIVPTHGTQQG